MYKRFFVSFLSSSCLREEPSGDGEQGYFNARAIAASASGAMIA